MLTRRAQTAHTVCERLRAACEDRCRHYRLEVASAGGFASAWPSRDGEFADKFNSMPNAAVLWAAYATALGYLSGRTFEGSLVVPLVLSLGIAVLLGVSAERVLRRRHGVGER